MKLGFAAALLPLLGLASGCDAGGDSTASGSGGVPNGGAAGTTSSGGTAGSTAGTGGSAGALGGAGGAAAGSGAGGTLGGGGSSGGGALGGGEHGFFPSTATEADAQAAFDGWKATYTEDCGANGIRVRADNAAETVSEGIGYGALLTAAWDDKATFDGIWTYYQKAVTASDAKKGTTRHLMGWKIGPDACALSNVIDPGAASDADLDMAMGLLQAECRWGGGAYLAGATTIIDAIKQYMTKIVPSGIALLPGDNWGDATGCMNPSYFSPAYYRVFAKVVPADAAHWTQMADDTYTFLSQVSHGTSGLPVDWASNGSSGCGNATTWYGYDAARTPWRIATDYVWFGTPAAKTWLDEITTWLEGSVGAAQLGSVKDGFTNDGSGVLGPAGKGNSTFVGAFAVGAMATSQASSDGFHDAFVAIPASNDDSYFKLTTRALYLLLSANRFSPGCY